MKKVLVTGATGFIGGYVIEELLRKGMHVIASSSKKENAAALSWFQQVTYVELDLLKIEDGINYFNQLGSPDLMIHLAWEGLPNYKNSFHLTENLPRHEKFLGNMLSNGLRDLTVTGTCLEYGMQEGKLDETMQTLPANAYAKAKDSLRQNLEMVAAKYATNFKWVRLFYTYGKGQNPNSLFSQLDTAIENNEPVFNMSGGEQSRDFLPVERMAAHIVDIAIQQSVTGPVNCCSGTPVKVKDFVATYIKEKGATIEMNLGFYPYTDFEPMNFWGDIKKLNTIVAP